MWHSGLPHHRFRALRYTFPHVVLLCMCSNEDAHGTVSEAAQPFWRIPYFQMAASAFSERYLGSKTDARVYTVTLECLTMFSRREPMWSPGSLCEVDLSLSFLQTANLAHRAGQLLQKQYLIIHPTADGNGRLRVSTSQTLRRCGCALMCRLPLYILHHHRKGSLPAHGQIHQSFNQREGQLLPPGEWMWWALHLAHESGFHLTPLEPECETSYLNRTRTLDLGLLRRKHVKCSLLKS